MNNNSNNIQKYIEAYDKTLENLGAESITVRAVQYSELNKSEVIPTIKNPKQTNNFWTKSCDLNNSDIVFFVSWNGHLTDTSTYSSTKFNGYNIGVRPIIIIEY